MKKTDTQKSRDTVPLSGWPENSREVGKDFHNFRHWKSTVPDPFTKLIDGRGFLLIWTFKRQKLLKLFSKCARFETFSSRTYGSIVVVWYLQILEDGQCTAHAA